MGEPFKTLVDAHAVEQIGARVQGVCPDFDRATFAARATHGLEPLELKARVRHIAAALRAGLPRPWPRAAAILVAALPPALPDEVGVSSGFHLWPLVQVVEDYGVDDPETSLPALREMTRRFSAEFAIRPFLAQHPVPTEAALDRWATDPDVHVRRLVSEGTRPRLPWGAQLRAAVADPRVGLARIERLVDDPSPYVRRSVANHLGDVAKDHVDLAVATAARWLAADATRRPLVLHALRTPLKRGHPGALALLGFHPADVVVTGARIEPAAVTEGEAVEVSATLRAAAAMTLRVDVRWQWPSARGWAGKTFNGGSRTLAAGETWAFRFRWSTRPVATRRPSEGDHRVLLRVQGVDQPPLSFRFTRA